MSESASPNKLKDLPQEVVMKKNCISLFFLCCSAMLIAQDKYEFLLKTDRVSGIYAKGDTVRYSVAVLKNRKICAGVKYSCQFSANGTWQKKQTFTSDDKVLILSRKFDAPVLWYTLKVEIVPGQQGVPEKLSRELGAVASPYEITAALEEPADFDAFWQKQRQILDQVPVEVLKKIAVPVSTAYKDKVVCYDVKIRCAGDKPVSGYLCMPKNAKPASLPALVTFQGAGVLGAWQQPQWGEKAITLNINAHGIENGRPDRFYRELKLGSGVLDSYFRFGLADKDLYYYKGVFARVMRALDYVKSLPEWDGKNLIVYGASQGGTQSIVAAAMDKKVTFCHAGVPALCDHGAVYSDRTAGWPILIRSRKDKLSEEQKRALQTLRYYDVIYFAKRVKCEIRMSAGLLDHVCSPTSVMAAYNNIPSGVNKSIQIRPEGTHGSASAGMIKRFDEVLEAAVRSNKSK